MALTLRLVCGVATPDIARAFLVSEPTMAARITRAKKKIAGSRIPYRVPRTAELPDRLRAVLGVIYLLFTTGHTAPSGAVLVRGDLVDERAASDPDAAGVDARRAGGARPAGAVADHRRAPGHPGLRVRAGCSGWRSRTDRCGTGPPSPKPHELIIERAAWRAARGRYVLQAAIAAALRRGALLRGDRLA